ncbi:MAG TPA: cytochrome c oxidase subunit II [Gammaproteobacteria bacterium]|nr:cytochrome c oxidase subunit II [Gammaproteobacteria bacterium]
MRNNRLHRAFTALPFVALPGGASAEFESIVEKVEDPAAGFDHLWFEVMVDITIIGVIFALLALYFLFRYRRRSPGEEGTQKPLSNLNIIGWALIPAFVFMADDFYMAAKGWQLYDTYRRVPENSLEVKLESAMWTWDYTYPNGVKTYNELRVPAGQPVVLRMTSRDTIHSHFIPDFRIKEDSMPGRVTYMWFYPQKPGEHIVSCAEYCGQLHSRMYGKVIVMPRGEFDSWYQAEAAKLDVKLTKLSDNRGAGQK